MRTDSYWEVIDLFSTMVCDTPVPYYDMGISCGLPDDFGNIPPEMLLSPSEITKGKNVFYVNAEGDSMEGLGIHDGDLLLMESTCHFNNRDVVYAVVNGQHLLKSYVIDDLGRHWLVPSNDKYDALQLTEDMDIRFAGRLYWQLRRPCESSQNLHKSIMRTLNKQKAKEETPKQTPSYDVVVEGLQRVAPHVEVARCWLGACRVLMDCKFIHEGRYDKFCELVRSILPNHPHLPTAAELQRMAVMCFAKPFDEWTDKNAPVHGKYYAAYHEVGEAMLNELP